MTGMNGLSVKMSKNSRHSDITRQVVLLSNTCRSSNSLVSFTNKVPFDYLSNHLNWECRIDSIGLDVKLRNDAVPADISTPSLLQVSR